MKNTEIVIIIIAVIILQSCTVYHNSSASLEGAMDKGKVEAFIMAVGAEFTIVYGSYSLKVKLFRTNFQERFNCLALYKDEY